MNTTSLHFTSTLSYKIAIFITATTYAYVLSIQPVDLFIDRDNYLAYAQHSSMLLALYLEQGWHKLVFNEPIWLGVNILLGENFSPEITIRTIIFFASFITAYVALNYRAKFFFIILIFLLLPQVVKNNVIHLRQGLAISVFLIGWSSTRTSIKYIAFLAACFIHSSFLMITLLYLLNTIFDRLRYSGDLRTLFVITLSLSLGFFGLALADLLGFRQPEQYLDNTADVSGLAFIFWLTVLILFASQGKRFLQDNFFQFSIILLYLSTYFLLPVTARVLESGLLIVLLLSTNLTTYRRYAFFCIFLIYFIAQWVGRIGLPMMGWGI